MTLAEHTLPSERRRRPIAHRRPTRLAGALALTTLLATPIEGPAQDLFIQGGTVHSVSAPPVVANVVISGDTIVAVDASASPGPDDRVIDAAGMVVTPGLVDFSTSLGLVEVWAVRDTVDHNAGGDEVRAGFRVVDGLNPYSILVPVTRIEGVTSVVSRPTGGLISGQSVWWDLAGDNLEQMVVLTPTTLDMGGAAAEAGATGGSRAAAMLRYREIFADFRAYQRDPSAYQTGQMRELSLSLVDLEALAAVLDGTVPVFFHAERQADILAAVQLAAEHGLQLIINGGAEAWAVSDALAERQIPVVVNPLLNAPYSFEELGAREDAAAILDRTGVPVILTTESAHNVRILRQVAGNAVRAGMDHESALAAVTLRPARAAGLDHRYGSIEPGKIANIVVWSGDPFELATRARHVIIRGRPIPLESRQTQLFERYRRID